MSSLLRHYSRYATGNVLSLAAGFISFPILTRTLDNHQFGLIGYLDGLLLIAVAGLKYGLGDAVLRFYPHGEDDTAFRRFVSSVMLVPMAASVLIWALGMLAVVMAGHYGWVENSAAALMAFAGIPFITFTTYVQWLMSAQEKSGINAVTNTVTRWSQTLLVVAMVLLVAPTVLSVYAGRLVAAVLIAVWVAGWVWRQIKPRFADVDLTLTRSALIYGLPLALVEMTNIAFVFVDRVMLKTLLGDYTAVGIYTIGSSLAMYVGMIVNTTLTQSYAPVMNRLYIQQGAEAVRTFKRETMGTLTYVVTLLLAGMLLVGEDFFHLISGPDKLPSAPVFVLLSLTFVLVSPLNIAGYGAMLVKQTGRLLAINSSGVVVNILLNLVLIPRFGVLGAVGATVITRPLVATMVYLTCPASLRCLPGLRTTSLAVVMAAVAMGAGWLVIRGIPVQAPLKRLLLGGGTLALVYVLPLLFFVSEFRALVQGVAARLPFGLARMFGR